ncbi:MAG: alpha/beta hydrolase [Saprospiraceae bacterium]|nr:alpha/beta hydrolase [Saprospiraceae bacterium]
MKIKRTSSFKNAETDLKKFNSWVSKLELLNGRFYERHVVHTSIGKTHIWGLNTENVDQETLVIFPGLRTTALIWDLDKGLDHLGSNLRIFMIETNGLPNLSDGKTPDLHSNDIGLWAAEVFEKLNIDKAFVAGASFGGQIALKLSLAAPEKIKAIILLNPGCLQPFSMSWKNLYNNILPMISPTEKNVIRFLNNAIFCKPNHQLSPAAEKMLIDYELLALTRYRDKTQKPYYMKGELYKVTSDVFLLEGDRDLLFPFQKSIDNARKHLPCLKEIKVFENVGHGIETFAPALQFIQKKIGQSTERYSDPMSPIPE